TPRPVYEQLSELFFFSVSHPWSAAAKSQFSFVGQGLFGTPGIGRDVKTPLCSYSCRSRSHASTPGNFGSRELQSPTWHAAPENKTSAGVLLRTYGCRFRHVPLRKGTGFPAVSTRVASTSQGAAPGTRIKGEQKKGKMDVLSGTAASAAAAAPQPRAGTRGPPTLPPELLWAVLSHFDMYGSEARRRGGRGSPPRRCRQCARRLPAAGGPASGGCRGCAASGSAAALRSCALASRDLFRVAAPMLYRAPFEAVAPGDGRRLGALARTLLSSLSEDERARVWGGAGAAANFPLFGRRLRPEDEEEAEAAAAAAAPLAPSRGRNRRKAKEAAEVRADALRRLSALSNAAAQAARPGYLSHLAAFDFGKFALGLKALGVVPRSPELLEALHAFVFLRAPRLSAVSVCWSVAYCSSGFRSSIPRLKDIAAARGRFLTAVHIAHFEVVTILRELTPHCCNLREIIVNVQGGYTIM
ncbi:MAG: hypothetical protein BJ554DRAFT_7443, partial [Olpidium bornovanus]